MSKRFKIKFKKVSFHLNFPMPEPSPEIMDKVLSGIGFKHSDEEKKPNEAQIKDLHTMVPFQLGEKMYFMPAKLAAHIANLEDEIERIHKKRA